MMRSSLAVAGLLVPLSMPVSAADFVLDKPHTQAEFIAVHLAISQVHGQIPLASGTATMHDGTPLARAAQPGDEFRPPVPGQDGTRRLGRPNRPCHGRTILPLAT